MLGMLPRLLLTVLATATVASGCASFDSTPNSGTAALSLRVPALAEQEATRVTLAVPCGIGALVLGDEVYETQTYAAPTDALRKQWGDAKTGWLRRTSGKTLQFLPDESTLRIQFVRSTLPVHGLPDMINQSCP